MPNSNVDLGDVAYYFAVVGKRCGTGDVRAEMQKRENKRKNIRKEKI